MIIHFRLPYIQLLLFLGAIGMSGVLSGQQLDLVRSNNSLDRTQGQFSIPWIQDTASSSHCWTFSGAVFERDNGQHFFKVSLDLPTGKALYSIDLANVEVFTPQGADACYRNQQFPSDFKIQYVEGTSRGKRILVIEVASIRAKSKVEFLKSFDLNIKYQSISLSRGERSESWKTSSVLESGTWLKVLTGTEGIYRLTFQDLVDQRLISGGVPSDQLRVFGRRGGAMSMNNASDKIDDLEELSTMVSDGGDGIFGKGDYLLFYGEDQVAWNELNGSFRHSMNPYADSAAYFVTLKSGSTANRVSELAFGESPVKTVDSYNYYDYYEKDLINLIKSGRKWYGEQLGAIGFLDFDFSVPDVIRTSTASVRTAFAARSANVNTTMKTILPAQGGLEASKSLDYIVNQYASRYASEGQSILEFNPVSANFTTRMSYDHAANPSAVAWIDFIEVNARRSLKQLGTSMIFRDLESVGNTAVEYRVTAFPTDYIIWDVTDIYNVRAPKLTRQGTNARFVWPADTLKSFISFSPSATFRPSFKGLVENQNLHALFDIEYLIVTHPKFFAQAEQVADYHREVDGLTSAVITTEQIYNEFSGGVQDIVGIREFARMLYHRTGPQNKPLKYMMLFGDASYDYKDRISGNTNYVPAHQSLNSIDPTGSVASDDFFGLLDQNESDSPQDLVDIGIGRLPASSVAEAQSMVNKILNYHTRKSMGDWRNWIAFAADDEDANIHMRQSRDLALQIDTGFKTFNVDKIFMDAFQQVSGAGGERYPSVKDAINERIRKGALIMYYVGHGGELGWAHERVLEVSDINNWDNLNNLPLFVTATCEFSRFDDPRRVSAGEYVLLNPNGGGIALLTTTRAVYSTPNYTLTNNFTQLALDYLDDNVPRLGDLARLTKVNTVSSNTSAALNSRCFALLGDPALRLAYPQYDVLTTSIPDTISALDKVKVSGIVANDAGQQLEDFNGFVYPLVFDKAKTISTLNNDGIGSFSYSSRENALFRGKVSVVDGRFEYEFVVPKDIDPKLGGGKISYYAQDGERDAHGYSDDFIIGGLSSNPNSDEQGPDVDLFMNNAKFVFGGMTDEDPDLYAEIWDENGINMVGNGIGHDIIAILDEQTAQSIVLNDYYESDVDSYQSGKIRYPFNDLEEGRHTLRLQVWDVNNNPSEGNTEFVVANSAEMALSHVLNYPNPFTTNTSFFFEHNKPGQSLDVRIEIFTISGRLVKVIDGFFNSDGYRLGPIDWDGKDEYGDRMGRGVYLYRLSVSSVGGEKASEFERLVILN